MATHCVHTRYSATVNPLKFECNELHRVQGTATALLPDTCCARASGVCGLHTSVVVTIVALLCGG